MNRRIAIMICPQRTSLRYGNAEGYGDAAFVTVSGRLKGCHFSGDWWVRAMPQFGPTAHEEVPEAYVNDDGTFAVVGAMSGSRHAFVVGRGADAIKVFSLNVVEVRPNTAGTVDLTGLCPK